jgi:hypothetical protein
MEKENRTKGKVGKNLGGHVSRDVRRRVSIVLFE